ncbi:MAG: hypothetical protein KC464_04870, partial [Myxococcales bacterium]|nr:hypothetical protein [Myxococcales bacterium]
CNVNPYTLGGDGDGGVIGDDAGGHDDGGGTIDARPPADAAPDACLPAPESCNTVDDDCDGQTDEDFNLDADPEHCGDCATSCDYTHAFGVCNAGACERGACVPGWVDIDGNPDDCEYFCIQTGGGVEVCDGRDNDCDGQSDEGFNLDSDPNNCGTCGHACNLVHASAACDTGQCVVDACDPGYVDLNPAVPGCEYLCTPSNGGVEICDAIDNDCDGVVDDGNPGGGQACGTDTGVCTAGTTVCSFGQLFCVGGNGGGPEVCDGMDNDCDGVDDNGFDFDNDPAHCGGCTACTVAHATAGCASGGCTVGACDFGWHDRNGLPGDGCESFCIATGAELCDGVDNDCDGLVDEGFDTQTDVNNCGSCGNVCGFANATATCDAGACAIDACDPNFWDDNGLPGDGCEYGCVLTNGGVETCDGQDNDCDGVIDDGNPGANQVCGTTTGACDTGLTSCSNGAIVCVGDTGPTSETCNNVDDDCDSGVDEGYDKLNDPRYCNNCAGCSLDHAIAGCSAGSCTVLACLSGWFDGNGLPGDGCELNCTPTGQEVCDGVDNDCDGLIDDADPGLLTPGNFCDPQGECAGTSPTCTGATGWDCVYGPTVEVDGNGDIVAEESLCDGLDNDCDSPDGVIGVDEAYPLKGTACAEDGTFGTSRELGICRGTGSLVCNGSHDGLACDVTSAGATPVAETCNNVDDDCDGHVDEPYDAGGYAGVRDVVVGPVTIGGQAVVMYRYEASRPNATAASAGFVETRACSVAGRLPWAGGDHAEADAACKAAGMRLCKVTRNGSGVITADEWGRFCEGAANRTFPYGNTYQGTTCNGSDYDPVPGGVNEDFAIPTGTLAGCQSQDLGRDLSGNLKEWTEDPRTVGGQTVYTLRGGSYDNHAGGLSCDFDLTVVPSDYTFANTGFRCCALSCPAGQSECGGACVNLATSNASCGACGRACGGGEACSNGYCCPVGSRACGDQCVPNASPCP